MPLNPPTYQGLDVYYSNNVFVNKVPVALWRPPAGPFNNGAPGTAKTGSGQSMYGYGESGSKAMYRDENTEMGQGALGDDDGSPLGSSDIASSISSTGPTQFYANATGVTGPDPNPSAPATYFELKPNDLPNQFPQNLKDPIYSKQISQYFKFGHIKMAPQDEPSFNLSARQVASNFIELSVHILDPIFAEFKFRASPLNSAYRPTWYNTQIGGSKTSEHITGCAADISMGTRDANIAMFKWIVKSGLKFRQCLFEASGSSNWIHVSYNQGRPKADASRVGYTENPPRIISAGQNGENLPAWLKP